MALGVGNYGAGLRPYPFVGLSEFSGAVHRQKEHLLMEVRVQLSPLMPYFFNPERGQMFS